MRFQSFVLPIVDALRYSKQLRLAAGWWALMKAWLSGDMVARASHLARAMTYADTSYLRSKVLGALKDKPGFENTDVWTESVLTTNRYRALVRDDPSLSRSIVLKAPGIGGEKGVLLMTFEYNWVRLLVGLSDEDIRWMDENYDLVLSTSWSSTDYAALALALSRMSGTLFVQSCNHQEIATIEAFHPRLKCLPTLPCDWINPTLYAPKQSHERQTDIVMVANWGEFKRHWDLFRALSRMPTNLKIVLIGQREPGRSREFIQRMA